MGGVGQSGLTTTGFQGCLSVPQMQSKSQTKSLARMWNQRYSIAGMGNLQRRWSIASSIGQQHWEQMDVKVGHPNPWNHDLKLGHGPTDSCVAFVCDW